MFLFSENKYAIKSLFMKGIQNNFDFINKSKIDIFFENVFYILDSKKDENNDIISFERIEKTLEENDFIILFHMKKNNVFGFLLSVIQMDENFNYNAQNVFHLIENFDFIKRYEKILEKTKDDLMIKHINEQINLEKEIYYERLSSIFRGNKILNKLNDEQKEVLFNKKGKYDTKIFENILYILLESMAEIYYKETEQDKKDLASLMFAV